MVMPAISFHKINVIGEQSCVRDAAAQLDAADAKVLFVLDGAGRPVGSVTDGDLRRAVLRGVSSSSVVTEIMNRHPRTMPARTDREGILAALRSQRISHMGMVDEQGRLVGIEWAQHLLEPLSMENAVVIMAGGEGRRLRPLTESCPKPMLEVGGRPLLETILVNCANQGLSRFYISVNYRAEQIEEYFGDGSNWGVSISYVKEDMRLGTAGVLSRLDIPDDTPLLVINGDILTTTDFRNILRFHAENRAKATMAVREYEMQVPYGVIETDNLSILDVREKPVLRFFVNAGIYVLDPEAIRLIPRDTFFDMTSLFDAARIKGDATLAYPLREYWLDIGHLDDFHRANFDYHQIFGSVAS